VFLDHDELAATLPDFGPQGRCCGPIVDAVIARQSEIIARGRPTSRSPWALSPQWRPPKPFLLGSLATFLGIGTALA